MHVIPLHPGRPPAPHDLWAAWSPDPWTTASLALACALYAVGVLRRRVQPPSARPDVLFVAGIGALALALLSPLDTASAALASAHMVQHLVVVLVAAPLLAASEPGATLLRGAPWRLRRAVGRIRHRLRLGRSLTARIRHPVAAFLAYTGVLWFWHAAVPYQAALDQRFVHGLEHAGFLLAGLLLWTVLLASARAPLTAPPAGILLSFGVAMQGALLSALLVFATTPWYPGYAESTEAWGLTALADQQLAGALMWVPGGLVHVAVALVLLVRWVSASDGTPLTRSGTPRRSWTGTARPR